MAPRKPATDEPVTEPVSVTESQPQAAPLQPELSPLERAVRYRQAAKSVGMGQVANARPGVRYFWWKPRSLGSGEAARPAQQAYRDGLYNRGLERLPADATEYIVDVPDAEIWVIPEEVWEFTQLERFSRALEEDNWVALQRNRSTAGSHQGALDPRLLRQARGAGNGAGILPSKRERVSATR